MPRLAVAIRALVAAAVTALVLGSIADRSVRAAITVTGNTIPQYNNTNPWATTNLKVGDTFRPRHAGHRVSPSAITDNS
jgi:hypothetical protein